jgi:YesN/AraC family two-component response regulator
MKHTILIVEDEFLISRNIRNILLEEDYDVIDNVESVEHAIEVLNTKKISLVIIDINLKKDKDGIDLGNHIIAKTIIPFIYITSYSDKITLDRAYKTRPQGYLVKPFKAIDIKINVSIVLHNYYKRKNEEPYLLENTTNEVPFFLKKSIDFINDNIDNHINIKNLASQTQWGSQHFQRVFTKYVGQTPLKFINQRKIEKCKTLLIETAIPTRQISYQLGFLSHGNFCTIFKKLTGKTPNEFRKAYKS